MCKGGCTPKERVLLYCMLTLTDQELEDERWRTVPGYPAWDVSDMGRLRRYTSVNDLPTLRSTWRKSTGNHVARILDPSGVLYTTTMGHLILTTFLGPAPVGHMCRHINQRSEDVRLTNLEWYPSAEIVAERRKRSLKITETQATSICHLYATGTVSLASLARRYGVSARYIAKIVDHSRRSTKTVPKKS